MKMRENLLRFKALFSSDEELLRLLHYKAKNYSDSPLDTSKPNILDIEEVKRWTIIEDVIKTTEKTNDLDDKKMCRLLFYSDSRTNTDNYLLASQDMIFDIVVHIDIDEIDLRLSWICDKVNELISGKSVTGIGKTFFKYGGNMSAPKGYVGYRLIYTIGSGKE
jgi:hypothetical protein